MKALPLLCLFLLPFLCSELFAKPIVISGKNNGSIVESINATKPDESGMVLTRELVLPAFKHGAFYRPFSSANARGAVARGNRVEAVAFSSIAELQHYQPSITRKDHNNVQQGQFILFELHDGRYLAVLPMASNKVYGQFFVENEKLWLKTGNFGTNEVSGKIPLVIWAHGDSPYAATSAVWEQVFESNFVAAQPRANKSYPDEPYGYLGWCSWEHYKKNISEDIIKNAFHTLQKSNAPIRWVMIDDGYLDADNGKLLSFDVNRKKFPNGWQPIMALKDPEQIKWVGIWRNFGGYMNGVSDAHNMSDLNPYLTNTKKEGVVLPAVSPQASKAFYDKMIANTKDNGFDFVKVDFHTRTFDLYKGTADPVAAMRFNNEALENATYEMGVPLLNCIAQPNVNSLQTKHSALTRSSPDYNQNDKNKNKSNTYQSFANHLWMGQTVWGDLDMFHTHDERDVKPMAIARAISGGPVYISDEPSKVKPEVLYPFAYEDGKLLRTSAPATLLPESFFIHPFRDEQVFRVVAPLNDNVAAIALFNFSENGELLDSEFSPKDYSYAGELLQPKTEPWKIPGDGLIVYDRETKSVVDLGAKYTTKISNFGAKLFLIYPKTKGWAVIGRSDKYLPAAAVSNQTITDRLISFTLAESGPLLIYSEKGQPKMQGVEFKHIGDGLYQADLEVVSGKRQFSISR